MNLATRFLLLEDDNSVFIFTIDTRNIVSGATNGSQDPLKFRIPSRQHSVNNCIVKVSDGRPDISITSSNTDASPGFTLNFATAGIYQITIIGAMIFSYYFAQTTYGYDKLKLISIDQWSQSIIHGEGTFDGCSNLIIKAQNTLVLPVNSSDFFRSIKGFESDLSLIDTSKCTSAQRILATIPTPLKGTLNPFWISLISLSSNYNGNAFDASVNRFEIYSDTLVSLSDPWGMLTFQNTGPIELICATPNVTSLFRIHRNGDVRTRCHLGRVDVRSVTNTSNWINGGMAKNLVDATLLGWAANLPYMQAGVTWSWGGSTYSNNPAVLAALHKITVDWGVIFTGLTMA